jgi:hypothetical protein
MDVIERGEPTGSYTSVWIATVIVGYAAALVNLPIRYGSTLVPAT